jgi:hypothetical protein
VTVITRSEDEVFPDARQMRACTPAEDGGLLRTLLRQDRIRRMSTRDLGVDRSASAALRAAPRLDYGQELMQTTTNHLLDARPARGVRLIESAGGAVAYGASHRTPILPRGWAPLTADQQRAVLLACDATANHLTFRLGSLSNPEVDYRVYQLHKESWAGLWVASRCFTDCDGVVCNRDLLGLGADAYRAVRIALEFFNSDLQARGESWRLGVELPAVPQGDPRRV